MENPDTWNDDIKAIFEASKYEFDPGDEIKECCGESVYSRIERQVVRPLRNSLNYILKILDLTNRYDVEPSLMWRPEDGDDPGFAINCNDVFAWGCADAVTITPQRLDTFIKSLEDAEDDGPWLYCARIRKMRPQGACYEFIDEKHWPLFDACGPVRQTGIGNPEPHPSEKTNEVGAKD